MIDHHEALVEARREIAELTTDRDLYRLRYVQEARRADELAGSVRLLAGLFRKNAGGLDRSVDANRWPIAVWNECASRLEALLGSR